MYRTLFFCIFLFSLKVQAQQAYWQQEVNYKIKVALDDEEHILRGEIEITYVNNSPDELDQIYIHLWPNAYKSKTSAFGKQKLNDGSKQFFFSSAHERGFIDSLDFQQDTKKIKWQYDQQHEDIALLTLNQPLKPGEKTVISTPFKVKIPNSFSRLGHIGQQYQVTQWYPKPAVYDHQGWHPMPYLDRGEFFSEYGAFEVEITLPKNYVVGATGILQEESEIMFLDSLANLSVDSESVKSDVPSSEKLKTISYHQDQIHDFAWFADKGYTVRKGKTTLPSGKEVSLFALYEPSNQKMWEDILEYMENAVQHYSKHLGEYPYSAVTTVDGALSAGAGMEYPMITVLGGANKFALEQVTLHEIGHNWFYGILGSNERESPWMDEGINTFYEIRYLQEYKPNATLGSFLGIDQPNGLTKLADIDDVPVTAFYATLPPLASNLGIDQPNNLPASKFSNASYGGQVYSETGLYFKILEGYLGQERFDQGMKAYYELWKFRHPAVKDLQRSLEGSSGEDLSWFFDDLIGSNKKLEFKISNVNSSDDQTILEIKNTGSAKSPVAVTAFNAEGEKVSTKWTTPFTGKNKLTFQDDEIEKFQIDAAGMMPLKTRSGTLAKSNGLFKTIRPLKTKFLGSFQKPDQRYVFFSPTIGTNVNDVFLLGFGLYNRTLFNQPFTYEINPMYSFGRNAMAGSGRLKYTYVSPQSKIVLEPQIRYRNYAGYQNLSPEIAIRFPQPLKGYSFDHRMHFSYHFISTDQNELPNIPTQYEVFSGRYSVGKSNFLNVFNSAASLNASINYMSDLTNFSQLYADFNYSVEYKAKKHVDFRLFAGSMLQTNNELLPYFQLNASGSPDITMNNYFWDRGARTKYAAIMRYQTDGQQGGFRSYVPLSANNYLISSQIDWDLPFLRRVSAWGEIGFLEESDQAIYGVGLGYQLIRNVFEIYLPIYGTAFGGGLPSDYRSLQTNLRFLLNVRQQSLFDLADNLIRKQ